MHYKKMALAALAASTFSTAALAVNLSHEITVGAGGSADLLDSKYNRRAPGGFGGFTRMYDTATGFGSGAEASLGYVLNINEKYDFGFEAFYNTLRTNSTQNIERDNYYKHSVKDLFGVRFLPGYYFVPNTKLFLDLGFVNVNSTLDISTTSSTTYEPSKMRHVSGYRIGGGIEALVFKNLSFRMGYAMMDGFGSTEISAPNANIFKVTPTIQTYTASFAYHFHV